ncbi:MAG: phosphoglycolate phosphatase [Halofilum sp. (in: g-proteobacteria)]|nr:phosphoglycolate phosphatase [Halofilum sp. (in: g-proteobacteria)]
MIRAVLCDLDGTLVDSVSELRLAVNRVRAQHGLPEAAPDEVRSWVGEGVETLLRRALAQATGPEADPCLLRAARRQFDAAYDEVLGSEAAACAGVPEGLARLRAASVPLACVTNKPERFARGLLESLQILAPMDVVVGGDSGHGLKPDAGPLEFAAASLGVAIGECLLVGDSAIDVEAARNAGCPVWCVRDGYGGGRPVDEVGADAVFDRFDELVDALLRQTCPEAGPAT